MDLLYSGNLDGFAIVSSDSDFTRLATRLRESGQTVIGLGRRRTPESLVAACDRFIYLEVLDSRESAGEPDEEAAPLPDLRRILVAAIDSTSHDDGWTTLSAVGSHISRNNPSFDSRNYGWPKLVELARAQDYVEVAQSQGEPVRVRLRPSGPAKGTTKKTTRKSPARRAQAAKKS